LVGASFEALKWMVCAGNGVGCCHLLTSLHHDLAVAWDRVVEVEAQQKLLKEVELRMEAVEVEGLEDWHVARVDVPSRS
jgi:hypothetical protein